MWIHLAVVGALMMAFNWYAVIASAFARSQISAIPILGSILAAVGLAGWLGPERGWWLVPFLVDPGGILWLALTVVVRSRRGAGRGDG